MRTEVFFELPFQPSYDLGWINLALTFQHLDEYAVTHRYSWLDRLRDGDRSLWP